MTPGPVGIEYERSLKARERYVNVRKALAPESQINRLLYFADNEQIAMVVAGEVFSNDLQVGVALVQEVYSHEEKCRVFVKEGNTVIASSLNRFLRA